MTCKLTKLTTFFILLKMCHNSNLNSMHDYYEWIMCFDITHFNFISCNLKWGCRVIFGNSLLGASAATYVGAGSVHSQTCPTHTQKSCQRMTRTHFVNGVHI